MCINGKIPGHKMTGKENTNETIDDRIPKANDAWVKIRRSFINDKNIDTRLRIQLFGALIGSILLYRLNIIPLNTTNPRKLQRFYAKCTRIITDGYYYNNDSIINNSKISQNNKIPTIAIGLKFYRLNMYYRLKTSMPIAYLNGTQYVNNELRALQK